MSVSINVSSRKINILTGRMTGVNWLSMLGTRGTLKRAVALTTVATPALMTEFVDRGRLEIVDLSFSDIEVQEVDRKGPFQGYFAPNYYQVRLADVIRITGFKTAKGNQVDLLNPVLWSQSNFRTEEQDV